MAKPCKQFFLARESTYSARRELDGRENYNHSQH